MIGVDPISTLFLWGHGALRLTEALSITREQVDSDSRTVTVGESKTDAGTGTYRRR